MNAVAMKILESVWKQQEEIRQLFIDLDFWNENRRPGAAPIHPDPDGSMRKLLASLGKLEADIFDRELLRTFGPAPSPKNEPTDPPTDPPAET